MPVRRHAARHIDHFGQDNDGLHPSPRKIVDWRACNFFEEEKSHPSVKSPWDCSHRLHARQRKPLRKPLRKLN